jgi:ribosomal protein S27E
MSEIKFSCHACGQVLQVGGDKAGRKAKCVQCGTVLTIPAGGGDPLLGGSAAAPGAPGAGAPGPLEAPQRKGHDPDRDDAEIEIADSRRPPRHDEREDRDDRERRDGREPRPPREEDDFPRRRRDPRDQRDDDWDDRAYGGARPKASPWEKVRLGFLIAFIGLCVMGGAHGIGILGALIGFVAPGGGLAIARIAAFFTFLGTIGAIVGHVFWLFVSNRHNLFAYAVAGLAVAGFYLLMQMVYLVMLFNPFTGGFAFVLLLTHLVETAHFVLVALFLRALAQQLDDPGLEKSVLLPMILAGAYGAYALVAEVVLMSIAGAVEVGRGYFIVMSILRLLGAALVVVVFVFILLAVFRGKQLVDRA